MATQGTIQAPHVVSREQWIAERRALLALIRTPATLARMEHLLATGKPLRN